LGVVRRRNLRKKQKEGRVERKTAYFESLGKRIVGDGWGAAARGLQRIESCGRTAAMLAEIAAEGAMTRAGRDETLHQKDQHDQDSGRPHEAIISSRTSFKKESAPAGDADAL
jgi:hypothetical protein